MKLEELGWNSFWQQTLRAFDTTNSVVGRVVAEHRDAWGVETEEGPARLALVSGACSVRPSVGDWVLLDNPPTRVRHILPRRTRVARKHPGAPNEIQVLAANVDTAILVMGLDGDFNLRRLERYLVLIRESGAAPLVVLNKADLAVGVGRLAEQTRRCARQVPVLAISAIQDNVAETFRGFLSPGESVALLGSSGAGKSTILNAILGDNRQRTNEARSGDDRGKHTTTSRQLFRTPFGWLVFDLPGLREIQPWIDRESIESTFDEIASLAEHCRFRDCTHQGEPGCAVAGAVPEERLASYHRLGREMQSLEDRHRESGPSNTKRRWKAIHKAMRHHPKYQR